MIIGEIRHLFLPENALLENGNVGLTAAAGVCISGLGRYRPVGEVARFPFARPDDTPRIEN